MGKMTYSNTGVLDLRCEGHIILYGIECSDGICMGCKREVLYVHILVSK